MAGTRLDQPSPAAKYLLACTVEPPAPGSAPPLERFDVDVAVAEFTAPDRRRRRRLTAASLRPEMGAAAIDEDDATALEDEEEEEEEEEEDEDEEEDAESPSFLRGALKGFRVFTDDMRRAALALATELSSASLLPSSSPSSPPSSPAPPRPPPP